MRARRVVAGAGLYLAVAGSTYAWVKSRQSVAKDAAAAAADEDAPALLGACGPAAAARATARRFDSLARSYDATVGGEETWMLLGFLRSRLLSDAKGKILEINAGSGRNLPHYRWPGVEELTMVDASGAMLRAAERKYYDAPLKIGYRQPHVRARFCLGDAQDLVAGDGEAPCAPPLPRVVVVAGEEAEAGAAATGARESRPASSGFSRLWRAAPGQEEALDEAERAEEAASGGRSRPPPPPPERRPPSSSSSSSAAAEQHHQRAKFAPGSFDVVVDTFGLCSVEDPVRALREAGRLVKPHTGRILLLEHGRPPEGTLGAWLLSERMDAAAPAHKARWGCWFNRDVDAAVRASGLRVVSRGSWHFGTTYVYELMAGDPAAAAAGAGDDGGDGGFVHTSGAARGAKGGAG